MSHALQYQKIFFTCRLVCPSGVIGHYLHASPAENMGKMGALVALADQDCKLEGEAAETALVRTYRRTCHHIHVQSKV